MRAGLAIIAALALAALASPLVWREAPVSHSCDAPCTVNLPPRTAEDDVSWNFGYANGRATATVFKFHPADR